MQADKFSKRDERIGPPMKIHLPSASFSKPVSHKPAAETASRDSVLGNWQLDQLLSTEGLEDQILRYQAAPVGTPQNSDYLVHTPVDPKSEYAFSLLYREWQISQHISNPHLLPVLDIHLDKPPYFIVTPQLAGGSLRAVLRQRGQLDLYDTLWILRQAAQAVCALHTDGWSSPLLQPENMMIEPDGHLTLTAIGHARPFENETEFDSASQIYADTCRLAGLFLEMTNSPWPHEERLGENGSDSSDLLRGSSPAVTALLTEILNPRTPCDKNSVRILVERLVRLEIEFLPKSA